MGRASPKVRVEPSSAPKERVARSTLDRITVVGARQHNLQDVTLSLPRDKLVVLTGPSGSGKSSLAFDTIYAEGQRRYVESLSAYARQFLEQLPKPDVERIDGLSPAIAIEQRPLSKSPRSTVGTVTEIADYLRVLFARVGRPALPELRQAHRGADGPADRRPHPLARRRRRASSFSRPCAARARASSSSSSSGCAARASCARASTTRSSTSATRSSSTARSPTTSTSSSIASSSRRASRAASPTASSSRSSSARGACSSQPRSPRARRPSPSGSRERFACVDCGISLPPIEPRMFSFNGPHGACPACDGLGSRTVVDPERVVGDPQRTLREGVVARVGPARLRSRSPRSSRAPSRRSASTPTCRGEDLPEDAHATRSSSARQGEGRARSTRYEGIVPRLEARLEGEEVARRGRRTTIPTRAKAPSRDDELGRFCVTRDVQRVQRAPPAARGARREARRQNIAELGGACRSCELRAFVASSARTTFSARELAVAEPLLRAVAARLGFLIDVGLDYLTLDRSAQTLSSGEGQRIRLATQIGAALVGVLYVLDEPSVGLHARDNARLIEAQVRLRDLGNSVIVVEHDREAILAADHVVDMGPGAGVHGGDVVAAGHARRDHGRPAVGHRAVPRRDKRQLADPEQRKKNEQAPDRRRGRARPQPAERDGRRSRSGCSSCVTGVSGSGKSSLVVDTLLPAARAALVFCNRPDRRVRRVKGLDHVDKVISIDQAPIGRTPRSNPATYTGVFALLRELYADAARGARARLQAGPLLVQREGRPLRGVPGRRRAARRDALPARRLRHVRHVRRPALQPRDARDPLPRHVDRRRARSHRRAGAEHLRRDPARARAARRAHAASASATSRSASRRRRSPAAKRSA